MAAAGIGGRYAMGRHKAEAVEVVMSEPAFPSQSQPMYSSGSHGGALIISNSGLTKREYAAIHAMQGLLANGENRLVKQETLAVWAVQFGDALLAELEKKP